jgi:hypothetical protein
MAEEMPVDAMRLRWLAAGGTERLIGTDDGAAAVGAGARVAHAAPPSMARGF